MTRFSSRKGQSAIEYLMTYGWMLLVVAIVGGAVITTVQDTQETCEQQMEGLDANQRSFGIEEFTVTSSGLNIELRNNDQEEAQVTNLEVGGVAVTNGTTVGMGDTEVVSTEDITSSENCNEYNVTIEYSRGDLDDELTGTIQGEMEA